MVTSFIQFLPLVKWPEQSQFLASCGSSYQLRTGSERVNIICEYQTVFRITFWILDLRSLWNYETTKLARKDSRLVERKPWAVRDPVRPPDLSELWKNHRRLCISRKFRVSTLMGLSGFGGVGKGILQRWSISDLLINFMFTFSFSWLFICHKLILRNIGTYNK